LGVGLGRTSVRLTSRPAPLPPRATGWNGDGISFQLLAGHVRVLNGRVRTSCGTTADFLFPTTAIPRNNEVYATGTGVDGSSMTLELEFVTTTRGVGTFTWSYGDACRATIRFVVSANL
ncbi:MAG TPA: hypothetical protein VGV65_04185, partial [Nocardioides sp.]|nr:hypothetical protein [Nocardioides sp.]